MATSKIYRAVETALTFKDSGGSAVITLQNLGFGAGRVSARYDRGAGSLAKLFKVRAIVQFETAPIVGEAVEIYLFENDGTYGDGTLGTADAALTSDKRKNGMLIGAVIVDTTSTGVDIVGSFSDVPICDRYFSVGVWNASAGDNLKNTANVNLVIVTPMPDESQ